ncbi:NAD(P)/FAD-dependent oxidoreductase [Streptomyces sp. TLI_185]|uniref:FAD-dependent oxidoreductase n=1 Tax=Streptomyces sp. TLI_185 TaxID=2485151 RepID=UPI000FA755F9|nr:FAD-dependent oxidoreductase [Streptomyces sp. TLI_185]RPF38930.1 2-polyprenyl-6-methoxyphenol hydroxylase-like FAD-dependent oxidoreductase [Streptomyces sp. TLI_185]
MAHVLVIGGGIAGTAAALALRKAGFEVTVHEAHPGSAEDLGAFLTLASNGMRALAQIDASAAVTALGFPLTSMRVLDDTGAELAQVPLGEAADPLLQYRCLRRGDLNAAVQAEAARRGIAIRHGARLASVQDGPDGVTAHFTDGSTATGDLLIGADGLNSTVRRQITPHTQPCYAGQRVFYGYTATAAGSVPDARITMVRGTTATFGYAVSPDGETHWFARVAGEPLPADEIADGSPADWRELLVPLLRKDATPAADLVAAARDKVMVTNATEIPVGTPWRSGRLLLIGDAAHAASPATGQGASMALEDAVILAKCLRDVSDTDTALILYEELRRPRVEHNITVSGNISRGTHPPSPAGTRGTPRARPEEDGLIHLLEWESDIREGQSARNA